MTFLFFPHYCFLVTSYTAQIPLRLGGFFLPVTGNVISLTIIWKVVIPWNYPPSIPPSSCLRNTQTTSEPPGCGDRGRESLVSRTLPETPPTSRPWLEPWGSSPDSPAFPLRPTPSLPSPGHWSPGLSPINLYFKDYLRIGFPGYKSASPRVGEGTFPIFTIHFRVKFFPYLTLHLRH